VPPTPESIFQKHITRIGLPRIEELIEDAIVDAYNESEQTVGFICMIEDNVAFPFATVVLGMKVSVTGVDVDKWGESVVAKIRRGVHTQTIPLVDLPLPGKLPPGGEWLVAYQHRARHGGGGGAGFEESEENEESQEDDE
jgi:hypothetical protein